MPIKQLAYYCSSGLTALFLSFSWFGLAGCSFLRAAPAPTTPFLIHEAELRPFSERSPWDAVWSNSPGQVMVHAPEVRSLFIAPVNTQYLNMKRNESGQWVSTRKVDDEDVKAITDLLLIKFKEEIKNNPETNLKLEDAPGSGIMTLQLALVELVPTKVLVNSAADIGGLVLPGSKLIEEAAAVAGQAAGGAIAAGTIAIELKLTDGTTGEVIAEAKDRENDPASVLPNVRDFEQYGWSRHTVAEWAKEFAKLFSTSASTKVDAESDVSFVPW